LHAVVDLRAVGHAAALGGDDDHAVGRARTVYGGGRSVFEDRKALDVGGIDGVEVPARNGDAVQNVERRGAGVDRVGASDGHGCGLARLTGVGKYRQTRNLTLKGLIEGRRRGVLDLLGLDGRYRACDGALFADAVGDHHHVVERLRIALQRDVAGNGASACGNREFERFVTDVLEGEGGPRRNGYPVGAVGECAHSARGSGNHVDPDQGLLVIRRSDDATDGHVSPPLSHRYGRQDA